MLSPRDAHRAVSRQEPEEIELLSGHELEVFDRWHPCSLGHRAVTIGVLITGTLSVTIFGSSWLLRAPAEAAGNRDADMKTRDGLRRQNLYGAAMSVAAAAPSHDGQCPNRAMVNTDCGFFGIKKWQCEARGCCHDPHSPNIMCYPKHANDSIAQVTTIKDGKCPDRENANVDCGFFGISPQQCEARGCCFDPHSPNIQCYPMTKRADKPIPAVDPGIRKSPEPLIMPEALILPKPIGPIAKALALRGGAGKCPNRDYIDIDCGFFGIHPEQCEARGCCFDKTSPNIMCFPKYANDSIAQASKSVKDGMCPNRASSHIDCGFPGISRMECEARGCCFDLLRPHIKCYPKHAYEKPAAPKPAVPKPAVPKPAVPKPAVPKPAVPKPAAPKPAVPKPAVPKPAVPKPAMPKPAMPKPATAHLNTAMEITTAPRPPIAPNAGQCPNSDYGHIDCGFFGIHPAECEARGCCFDQNSPGPHKWCYPKQAPQWLEYYLPKKLAGTRVLVPWLNDDARLRALGPSPPGGSPWGLWQADNTELHAPTVGLAFRTSKDLDSKSDLTLDWGSAVPGLDDDEDWTRIYVQACDWIKHDGKYAIGVNLATLPSLQSAQAHCMKVRSQCKAITCSTLGTCNVRGTAHLKPSKSNETTYVPSASCLEVKAGIQPGNASSFPPSFLLQFGPVLDAEQQPKPSRGSSPITPIAAVTPGPPTSTTTSVTTTSRTTTSVTTTSVTTTSTSKTSSTSTATSTTVTATTTTTITTTPYSLAPVQEIYMYRAMSYGADDKYTLGNINTANIDGVIWYLMNEVVTMYTNGSRCPRKFNISRIRRFKVHTKATKELYAENMTMGARFSFDQGKCVGRCFPENKCSLEGDCKDIYGKYGYIPGCNNFYDKYPFPAEVTPTPGGIWYSLPLEGRCKWPTGAHNCTWSYEDAGEISLEELEATAPMNDPDQGNCCDGKCTGFWDDQFSIEKSKWRMNKAMDLFKARYPWWQRSLPYVPCDFKWMNWYAEDKWEHLDPWLQPKLKEKKKTKQPFWVLPTQTTPL